ncbi:MAG: tetratricopeptide repeat protein [Candidatus Binatia bacterium]
MSKAAQRLSTFSDQVFSLEVDYLRQSINRWVQERFALLVFGLGIALLVLCVLLYWRYQHSNAVEALRQGIVALQNREFNKAIDYLQRANRGPVSGPEKLLTYIHLGDAYMGVGKDEEALRIYSQGSEVAVSEGSDAYLRQILFLKVAGRGEKEGNMDMAISNYEKSAQMEGPLKVEAFASSAYALGSARNTESSQSYYEKAAKISETHPLTELFIEKVRK